MNKLISKAGRSTTELILVMLLLILFSVSSMSLVASSSDAYIDTVRKNDTLASLRVAQSYLYTKVRQGLETGAVSIRSQSDIPGGCLVISNEDSADIYETYIFVKDGQLCESLVLSDTQFDPEESFQVVKLDQLKLKIIPQKGLYFETVLLEKDGEKSLKGFAVLLDD